MVPIFFVILTKRLIEGTRQCYNKIMNINTMRIGPCDIIEKVIFDEILDADFNCPSIPIFL